MASKVSIFPLPVEANPYAAHIYFNRGNLQRSLENYESAEQDYRKGTIMYVNFTWEVWEQIIKLATL